MMNKKGFGKTELLTIIVLILIVSAILLTQILGIGNDRKFKTMEMSARTFSKNLIANMESSDDEYKSIYYLEEAIDKKILSDIKSPFSSGYCDENESKIEIDDYSKYITLKCDEYLIEKANEKDDHYKIYKVSNWSEKKKNDDDESVVKYNCQINGKDVFDDYYEPDSLLYKINTKYKKEYYDLSNIEECKIVDKTFYRTLELANEKEKK